jgi:DNA-binding LacI/PurR family transcriptional regulator
VVSGAGSQEPDLRHVFTADVDGVLLDSPVTMPREEIEAQCPVVVIDDPKTPGGGSGVWFDLRADASELADHLVSLGHRTVLYLDTPRQAATFSDRRRYLSEQLRRHHKDAKVLRAHSDIEIGGTRPGVRRLIRRAAVRRDRLASAHGHQLVRLRPGLRGRHPASGHDRAGQALNLILSPVH